MVKPKLGKIYEVEFLDHFATDDKSPEQAITQSILIKCWGRCVGIGKDYVVLSHFWENDTSENNDNTHILKNCIKKLKELK